MNAKSFSLPLICLAALVSGCVSTQSNRDLAGRINGQPIPYAVYMDSYRAHYNNFQVLNNRIPDAEEKEQIKRQTWRDATKHIVLTGYFQRYSLGATAQEAIDSLRNNPPDYILRSPKFQTGGKFDTRLYQQSLLMDTPENLAPLRRDYQDYKIPILKLQKHLVENELLTSSEKKLAKKILQSKADLEFTVVDAQALQPYVSEDEIYLDYQKNLAQYKLEPYCRLAWVLLPVIPSEADVRRSTLLADSLYLELSDGTDVAELMTAHEKDFPHLIYHNSGFIKNLDLDPALYALLSSLQEGTFSKPVPDEGGLTIYELEQRTKSLTSYYTLRIPYVPSEASIGLQRPLALRLARLASTLGLAAAAEEMDLDTSQSGRINPNSAWFDDSAVVSSIAANLSGKKAGHLFEPVYSPLRQAWVLVSLEEYNPAEVRSLAQVKDQIAADLAEQKRGGMALSLATAILNGQQPDPASSRVLTIRDMDPAAAFEGQPAENLFYQVLRRHYNKEKQSVIPWGSLYLVPGVLSVRADKQVKPSEAEIRRIFAANLSTDWFEAWMEEKVSQASLKIFVD